MGVIQSRVIVDWFNGNFKTGDKVSIFNKNSGDTYIGIVQAPAEVVYDQPLVSIEDVGLVDLNSNIVSLLESKPKNEVDDFVIADAVLGVASFEDDDKDIPLENIEIPDQPADNTSFGGDDFGGGGSEGDW